MVICYSHLQDILDILSESAQVRSAIELGIRGWLYFLNV